MFQTTTFLGSSRPVLSPDKPSMDSIPSCYFCSASPDSLLRCSACKVVRYCSKDHQILDRPQHAHICKSIVGCSARLAFEERKLRNQPDGDMFAPANVFEEHVGHFWGMHNTRPYMRARYALVEAFVQVRTRDAVVAALEHVMDCLRLCRSDNMGLRDLVPALLLRLGRDQECYDFVKWYGTTGSRSDYDWGDMNQPFLDVKGADVWESPKYLCGKFPDLSHIVSITLLKIRLLLAVRANLEGKEPLPSNPALNQIDEKPGRDAGEEAVTILQSHVKMLYHAVDQANTYFWHAMRSPGKHLEACPPHYSAGSIEEMQMVLRSNYLAWKESPGAIDVVKAIFRQEDY
jgi:hypothetical protein